MSDILKELSGAQKKAVIGLACIIEAQGKGGRFRSNDPEMDIIVRECFGGDWVGNWDDDYRHSYLGNAAVYAANNQEECFQTVKELDNETKFAFKNMMIDIIGDNAMMMLAAAFVYKEIGMPTFTPPPQREKPRVERNEQEDDGTYVLKDPFYRLVDVGAVRGETDKFFNLVDDNGDSTRVEANYDFWLSQGVCPVSGIVGIVDPNYTEDTPEGKLCYLATRSLVVPVLEWGLEKIDDWEYRQKSQNNKMLSCDRSGKLCRKLRAMKKPSGPKTPTVKKAELAVSDRQVVRYDATVQQRIEDGVEVSSNYIDRSIRLTYTKRGSELQLEVFGVMQPRAAKFKSDNGRILTYEDTSRPFTFYEVETEPVHNSIVRVSIFQKNQYFQDIEYRYTRDDYNG